MSRARLLLTTLGLLMGLSLFGQVEPELGTVTDLPDVYKSTGGVPSLVAIYDYTPASRGVFETKYYLTLRSRNAALNGAQGFAGAQIDATIATLFAGNLAPAGASLYIGYVFGARVNAAKTNLAATDVDVRMFPWPATNYSTVKPLQQPAGTDVIGALFYTDAAGALQKAFWNTDAATTLRNPASAAGGAGTGFPVTHARFKIAGAAGVGNRTIDLPVPWKIVDSPATVSSKDPNYQREKITYGGSDIEYDTWSSNPANDNTQLYGAPPPPPANAALQSQVLGNFFYAADYLSWIFGGKAVRNTNSDAWITLGVPPATTQDPFKAAGVNYPTGKFGFAVRDVLNDAAVGWGNLLPGMTRYQASKSASINVFLDKGAGSKLRWIYRFLAPWYPAGLGYPVSEEEGGATAGAAATASIEPGYDPIAAATDPLKLRALRLLDLTQLYAGSTALQKIGPDTIKWNMTTVAPNTKMWAYDNGVFISIDPVTPSPYSTALANTYRMLALAVADPAGKGTTLFGAQNAQCPGEIFVVPFMNTGPNDSKDAALDQKAAIAGGPPANSYVGYYGGNSGLGGGNYSYNAALPAMTPGNDQFHPGVLSAVASHSPALANVAAKYGAPWVYAGKALGVSTRVISLAVPGAYGFKSDNNGRNPHEQMYVVARWGDKKTPTWKSSNPTGQDKSVTVGGSVYYYPSADPQELEANLKSLAGSIVSAQGALSAPATPATGVQNATQAYFGTFVTNPRNDLTAAPVVWSGNLYSIGLDRSTGSFQFYGNKAGASFPIPPADLINTTATTDAFDRDNLWSLYKIFSIYQNPNPLYLATYAADASNSGVLVGPLSWKDRRLYMVNATGALEKFSYTYAASNAADSFSAAQIAKIKSDINSGTQVVGGPIVQRVTMDAAGDTNVKAMMRWVLGAFDPTHLTANTNDTAAGIISNGYVAPLNRDGDDVAVASASPSIGNAGHSNLVGDIINSAPLTVELSKNLADTIVLPVGGALSAQPIYTKAYNPATGSDPHTRLLFVGTNTGTLHALVEVAYKPVTGVVAGVPVLGPIQAQATELWAFMPPNLLPIIWDMYQDYVLKTTTDTGVHRYGVDGDPVLFWKDQPNPSSVVGDTRVGKNAGEEAVVIFGMRKGSRDYYGIQINDGAAGVIIPHSPKLAFHVDAIAGKIIKSDLSTTGSTMINKLGLGTSVPTFGTVLNDSDARMNAVFISGGYANAQVETNFQKKYADGAWRTGRLILALNPLTGANVLAAGPGWDYSDEGSFPTMGSIPGGVTPLSVVNLTSGLTHRLYFGDMRGNLWAINSTATATNPAFRADDAKISTWLDKPRLLISNLDKERFTNPPDAYRLPGDYPVMMDNGLGTLVRPLTVFVSTGSGDRNNPIDAEETYPDPFGAPGATTEAHPAIVNRFYMVADLQNQSSALDIDSDLVQIDAGWAGGKSCYDSPIQDVFDPTSGSYLWNKYRGYYFQISDATGKHSFADPSNGAITFDKMMVSPLIKENGVFFSFFSVDNTAGIGYNCSAFAQTRTFRYCDLLRPLYFDPRSTLTSTVNKDERSATQDSCTGYSVNSACSGLAFAFFSLSSQLVDAGDYVMQGGAKSTETSAGSGSYTENRPDIQSVKNTGKAHGFRLKAWRVVR